LLALAKVVVGAVQGMASAWVLKWLARVKETAGSEYIHYAKLIYNTVYTHVQEEIGKPSCMYSSGSRYQLYRTQTPTKPSNPRRIFITQARTTIINHQVSLFKYRHSHCRAVFETLKSPSDWPWGPRHVGVPGPPPDICSTLTAYGQFANGCPVSVALLAPLGNVLAIFV
jgi:hypothetical protein